MAKFLSREDTNLTSSIVTSRSRDYTDIDLSFQAKPGNGDIFKKFDAAAVKQALKNLILTNRFEKPFEPTYGGNVTAYFFELADEDTEDEIRDTIIRAVQRFEPRARLVEVNVDAQIDRNIINVGIQFQVANSTEIVSFTTTVSRLR